MDDTLEQFYANYAHFWIASPTTGCLVWTGTTAGSKGRRPVISIKGRKKYVSRVVCELAYGPPSFENAEAAHKPPCFDPLCIEGAHLYWATKSQNAMDKPAHVRSAAAKIASDAYVKRCRDHNARS